MTDWRRYAACLDEDPDLFFPDGETGTPALIQIEIARGVCAYCPVQQACLDDAMAAEGGGARDTRHGMWGALHSAERHNLYVRRARQRQRQDAS